MTRLSRFLLAILLSFSTPLFLYSSVILDDLNFYTDFPNPERGFHSQIYYTSGDLSKEAKASSIAWGRETSDYHLTLYLHSYYLTDYMESVEEFLRNIRLHGP